MSRLLPIAAALAFLAAVPFASADDLDGLQIGGQQISSQHFQRFHEGRDGRTATVSSPSRCPTAVTQVLTPTNVVTGAGASGLQQIGSAPVNPNCHPLVSTRVVAPVNLAIGSNSTANQEISSQMVQGSLVTRNVVAATNKAVGTNSTARQKVLGTTAR